MTTGRTNRAMRYGNAVTSPQTLEIPPLHTALETLADPGQPSTGAIEVTICTGSRFGNNIHMLTRNKMNSRECSSCIIAS